MDLSSVYAAFGAKAKNSIAMMEVQSRRTAPLDNDHQVSNYDRSYGSYHDSQFIHLPPRTVKSTDLLGRSETFIVETFRTDDGDVVFIE